MSISPMQLPPYVKNPWSETDAVYTTSFEFFFYSIPNLL